MDSFDWTGRNSTATIGRVSITGGKLSSLPKKVQIFITHCVHQLNPRSIQICNGSKDEATDVIEKLVDRGTLSTLSKYKDNYLCRTDPDEDDFLKSKTFVCTTHEHDAVPRVQAGKQGMLGRWVSQGQAYGEVWTRFMKCMSGRIMYVIPFCMGQYESPLRKIGVQITDSTFVLLWLRIMMRVSPDIWNMIGEDDFVKCVHSMGCPRPVQRHTRSPWPNDPDKVYIVHYPEDWKIKSFGGGFGGASLEGKHCFSLRLGSAMAREEGWMAEHMAVLGITTPQNKEFFVAVAFPSGCGKSRFAMMNPSLPGYTVRCIGDEVAWMRFNEDGQLVAINPLNGFYGYAPGVEKKQQPHRMATLRMNSIFCNVAQTADGRFYWEGLHDEVPKGTKITDWRGHQWQDGGSSPAAHPKASYTSPATQCPVLHPRWEDPEGVPISAIIFGGKRPQGVPLVFQATSWAHGVVIGASVKSEIINEQKKKQIIHDPMTMASYIGYNFGHYLKYWLELDCGFNKMPEVFHVNWFGEDEEGKLLWPGGDENIRVLDWILRRCNGDNTICEGSPIGFIPKNGSINLTGLGNIKEHKLLNLSYRYLLDDTRESRQFLLDQVGTDTPKMIIDLLKEQEVALEKALEASRWKKPTACHKPAFDSCYACLSKPFDPSKKNIKHTGDACQIKIKRKILGNSI